MEIATIISFAASLVAGAIAFYLKRTHKQIDDCATKDDLNDVKKDISNIQSTVKDLTSHVESCVKSDDFRDCQTKARDMSNRFASKEEVTEIKSRMDKLEKGIDYLKENAVRKDDFVRVMTRLESKIDELVVRGK